MRMRHLLSATLTATMVGPVFVGAPQAQEPAAARPPAAVQGGERAAAVRSPEIAPDGRATFRLRAPSAQEVVAQIGQRRIPMQKDAQGVWSGTSDSLEPDMYTYSLVVDGASMNDPGNRQVQTSFGSFQSMLVVPGPKAWLPQPNVPKGAITKHTFHSVVAGDDRDFYVYTPAGYDAHRAQAYPVLYLLHGLGDDAERWMVGGGGAHNIFDNLIAQGKAVPMVVVTTLGYGTSTGPAGGWGAQNIIGYEKILLDEVMPIVDRRYHVGRTREQRAIAGLSMGGAESLYVGLRNLDRFAWIGAFSSALLLFPAAIEMQPAPPPSAVPPAGTVDARGGRAGGPAQPQTLDPAAFAKTFPTLDAKANPQIRMLWIACGTADGLIAQNRQFKDWLRSKGVQFTEEEIPNMAHVWPLWRQNVTDMAPRLFQTKK